MPGADGAARIKEIMSDLRRNPPPKMDGQAVIKIGDLTTGEILDPSGNNVGRFDLPSSDVIILYLADGTKVVARPSGTEPKIKFYILVRASGADLSAARALAILKIKSISKEISERTGNAG